MSALWQLYVIRDERHSEGTWDMLTHVVAWLGEPAFRESHGGFVHGNSLVAGEHPSSRTLVVRRNLQ